MKVAILMGSDSDLPIMREAQVELTKFGIETEMRVLSAHRTPDETLEFARNAADRGIRVIIAGAGAAAHLPGFIAAVSHLPVIGVPIASGPMQGQDALLAIVQMPKGVPVACVAINGAANAGLLAAQIIATGNAELAERYRAHKQDLRTKVLAKTIQN